MSRSASAGWGYAWSLGLVALASGIAVAVDRWTAVPNLSLVFVLPVVIAAVRFGWGPALAASLAGVVAYNFFLIEPRHTLRVEDPANVWALVLLLLTAAIVSVVADQARRRALEAQEHADQAAALQTLARALVAAGDRPTIVQATAEAIHRLFKAPAVVLLSDGGACELAAAAPAEPLDPRDQEAANWALASRRHTRGGAYPADDARFDFWPVRTRDGPEAVIGVDLTDRERFADPAPERLMEIVAGHLAVALERERLAAQLLEGRVEREGQRLKADLLAAVSHDLKTPLSTILISLQSLRRFAETHDPNARDELLELAERETARLSGLVANLLDMSRIDAEAVTARPAPADAADLVASAAARAWAELAGHKLTLQLSDADEPVMIDYPLAETALAAVLENAGKYSPTGSRIVVRTAREDRLARIDVLDEGPGFPTPAEPLFGKFVRGVSGDGRPPGTGLGLAIAKSLLEAQGGRIEAGARRDGARGGRVSLFLPLACQPG